MPGHAQNRRTVEQETAVELGVISPHPPFSRSTALFLLRKNGSARIRTENQGIMSPLPDSCNVLPHQQVTDSTLGNVSPSLPLNMQNDPEFRAVAVAWPMLPPAIRAGIVALIEATKRGV